MSCSQVQRSIIEIDQSCLPADVSSHMASCAPCRNYYERTKRTVQLISLKRYEKPDAFAEERIRNRIRDGLAKSVATETVRTISWPWRLVPGFSYALAALFIAFLGLQIFSASRLPDIGPVSWGSRPVDVASLLAASTTNTFASRDFSMTFIPSNKNPANIQYGGQPSKPVGFVRE